MKGNNMNIEELADRMMNEGTCLHDGWTETLLECLSEQLGFHIEHKLDDITEGRLKEMDEIPEHLEYYAEEHECL